jgi:hypothetical protein
MYDWLREVVRLSVHVRYLDTFPMSLSSQIKKIQSLNPSPRYINLLRHTGGLEGQGNKKVPT